MNDEERLNQFLSDRLIMVLGVTLDDGSPWAVPVKIQERKGSVFEWDSDPNTVHSKAIEQRPEMAVVMFDKAESVQFGLYLKGKGELVSINDKGFGRYHFTTESAWINDESFVKRPISLSLFS